MAWSAEQYLKFEDERTRPARDLLAQVPLSQPQSVIDLGCGPGNSTELLVERFSGAEVAGLDSDENMLTAARQRLPQCRFMAADIGAWMPETPVDLLFANAVFQWVPDHLAVLNRLMDAITPGGVLAVQMPDNLAEPSHLAMDASAHSGLFAEIFAGRAIRRPPLPDPRAYFEQLGPKSARIDLWHSIYQHKLADPAAIVEWVKGTGLRPYLDVLPPNLREAFLADYLARITAAYPPLADGSVLLRFPRLFIVAVKD
ncbi:trans-aconitate 2-methyltransferase [Kaistia soli DSM 19436]|uniref:Trans-aconitate 2-methyltransferase n=1 Tax=Kaistia soli DSM 19436 TaxID=1122133 RepID=A0A1M4ZSV1_9HYPH|nr:trans-aconitate 2-methyltransferase [Kaistia soli]SHF21170.1 trans-aconitate 2-methyltransferase [Kaistia soli DSM 19436]